MRTTSLLALGGLLCGLLTLPASAQERGPDPLPRAEGQSPQRGPEGPRGGELRERLRERFDADGDGRLSEGERAEARRALEGRLGAPGREGRRGGPQGRRELPGHAPEGRPQPPRGGLRGRGDAGRGRGPSEALRGDGGQGHSSGRASGRESARPGLERLLERARALPPHERAELRRGLAERLRARHGARRGEQPLPFHRPQAEPQGRRRFEPQGRGQQQRFRPSDGGQRRRMQGDRRPAPEPQRRMQRA